MPENACSVNQIWESQTFHSSPVAFVFRCCRVISLTVHDGGQNADTIISIPRANIISPNITFVPLLIFFLRFYGVLCFPAGEDKTVALECKNALAAAHSDIAHETAFFPAPNRAAHKNCFALLTYQIRQCKHHQNNQNNCHFFLLNQTCCYVDIIVMTFAGNPPLQALWIICSNFLPLSVYNFIAALCNCPLIGYIIPLSAKKSNIWHSASFFLFTTNIDFAYCVLTCSFYISDGIIPSLRHIQFDMIKRCCTFLCSAAIIY